MNSVANRQPALTVEEYFALEETSSVRHEYIEGYLYALAGASPRHNQIVLNIASAFRSAARGKACRIQALEVMLRVAADRYYYPDVQVICDAVETGERYVTDPCVIVEVLSPTTASIDRREKLFAYREIERLRAYYIVHQDAMKVEQHWLDEDGVWWSGVLFREGTLHVPCLGLDLSLADIYEGVLLEDARPQS